MRSSHKLCDIYEYIYHHSQHHSHNHNHSQKSENGLKLNLKSVCLSIPSELLDFHHISCNSNDELDTTLLPLLLRKRLFYLFGQILHVHKHYSSWYSELFKPPEHHQKHNQNQYQYQKNDLFQSVLAMSMSRSQLQSNNNNTTGTTSSTGTTNALWFDYQSLQTSYLHILKRVSESGNDLFQLSPVYQEQILIGDYILQEVLVDMLGVVHGSSRHVPLHMMALMHQNLGLVYFNNGGGAGGVGVGNGSKDKHSSNGSDSGNASGNGSSQSQSESQSESVHHLLKSIEIFQSPALSSTMTTTTSTTTGTAGGSASTSREYIYSLLLYTVLSTAESTTTTTLPESCHHPPTTTTGSTTGTGTTTDTQCDIVPTTTQLQLQLEANMHHMSLWETLTRHGDMYLLNRGQGLGRGLGLGQDVKLSLTDIETDSNIDIDIELDSSKLQSAHTHSIQLQSAVYYHSVVGLMGDYIDTMTLFHTTTDIDIDIDIPSSKLKSILLRDCIHILEKTYLNIKIARKLFTILYTDREVGETRQRPTSRVDSTPNQQVSWDELTLVWDKVTRSIDVTYIVCVELYPELVLSSDSTSSIDDRMRRMMQIMKTTVASVDSKASVDGMGMGVHSEDKAEEDEWEECSEGDEDCEAYEVEVGSENEVEEEWDEDEDEMPVIFDIVPMGVMGLGHQNGNNLLSTGTGTGIGIGSSSEDEDEDENENEEDENEDDDDSDYQDDLLEIRERYAQQTARRTGTGSATGSGSGITGGGGMGY